MSKSTAPAWTKEASRIFSVLTFDCYGTLIDWVSGILSAIQPILARHGVSVSDQELLAIYAKLEPILQQDGYRLYKNILREVMEKMAQHFRIRLSEEEKNALAFSIKDWKPFPDTVEALRTLKEKFKLAIISNIDNDLLLHSLKHLEVPFVWTITAEQVKAYKPSPENFRYALKAIGLPREKILHVAQSIYHDIVPAKSLGFTTVWVNRTKELDGLRADKPADGRPDLEVPDLMTLASILRGN